MRSLSGEPRALNEWLDPARVGARCARQRRIRPTKAEPRTSQVTRFGEVVGVQSSLVRSVDAIECLIDAGSRTPPFEAHLISDALTQHGGNGGHELIDQPHL